MNAPVTALASVTVTVTFTPPPAPDAQPEVTLGNP